MEGETRLDSATFQLTPTRTRCELVITGGGVSEKLASGLVRPFVLHLKAAEEQISKGGYSISLNPPAGSHPWFTKGTVERFVRFVSTPEVLERSDTIETEIVQIEKSISVQCSQETSMANDKQANDKATAVGVGHIEANKIIVDANQERAIIPFKSRRDSVDDIEPAQGENSKVQLLRVLETRKMALQKEQGMAYARAAAAGFDIKHMADLVSFAECFGALRLRKACLNFMELCKRKHEAGLWLDEMELATMEPLTIRSDMSSMGASGIILTSDSVICQVGESKIPAARDDPSNQSELNGTGAMPDANGVHAISNHNRDNRLSSKHQVLAETAGSNEYLRDHIQLPTMPALSGQPPQYMQNFQSFIAGPGPPMQGFHGFPIQGMQIGSPYYQNYPGSPHWPHYVEDPRLATVQRAESGGRSNISAGLKHHSMDEKETGSPKSISISQDLTDHDGHSDSEKESMLVHQSDRHQKRRSASSRRRSTSPRRRIYAGWSDNKHSGTVVIRNINFIASKRHDGIGKDEVSEESDSEGDSDSGYGLKEKVEDVIGLFEKKHKEIGALPKQKGACRHSVDSCNSWEKDGNHEVHDLNAEAGGGGDDNPSWQVFQKYLLRDERSSLDDSKNDNKDDIHAAEQADKQESANDEGKIYVRDNLQYRPDGNMLSFESEMGLKGKDHMIGKDSLLLPEQYSKYGDDPLQRILKLEGSNGKLGSGIKEIMPNEKLLLPQRVDSARAEKDGLLGSQSLAEIELSTHKKPTTDELLIISQRTGEMDLVRTNSQRIAADDVEHTILRHNDHLHADRKYGESLVDDSFMVPTRSIAHEQANIEWKTQINMDSELPSIDKAEHFNYNLMKVKSEIDASCEPDDLFMLPQRNSGRESLGLSWNPALDNDMQALVNIADKKHPDADLNGYVDKITSPQEKKSDTNAKELQGMKKAGREGKLKATHQALEKRKTEMAAGNGKSAKLNMLADAKLRAGKLQTSKAGLQKNKKEKEEEERKRVEELLIQRQKRIAGRTNSCVNKSASTSYLSKQQHLNPQKGQTSNNIGTVRSFSGPMMKATTGGVNRLTSHKSNLSNHCRGALNQSMPSRSERNNENGNLFRQSGSVSQASKNKSSTGKSTKQGVVTQAKKNGNLKVNGTLSVSTRTIAKESSTKSNGLSSHESGISH